MNEDSMCCWHSIPKNQVFGLAQTDQISGGFGSYLFGMSEDISNQTADHKPQNTKNPKLSWMIVFLFSVSFLGLFTIVPLRKVSIFFCICGTTENQVSSW